jgi:hypothetical protein
MRAALLFLTLCLATVGCSKHSVTIHRPSVPNTLVAGTFISASGKFTHSDATITRELTVTPGPKDLTWHLSRTEYRPGGSSSGGYGNSMPLPAPAMAWFIFVESPDRLWFFNGSNKLSYHLSETGRGVSSGPAIVDGKVRPESPPIPAALLPRLPAELQKLIPAEPPPVERPSF